MMPPEDERSGHRSRHWRAAENCMKLLNQNEDVTIAAIDAAWTHHH